jgi:hypothetical protein
VCFEEHSTLRCLESSTADFHKARNLGSKSKSRGYQEGGHDKINVSKPQRSQYDATAYKKCMILFSDLHKANDIEGNVSSSMKREITEASGVDSQPRGEAFITLTWERERLAEPIQARILRIAALKRRGLLHSESTPSTAWHPALLDSIDFPFLWIAC